MSNCNCNQPASPSVGGTLTGGIQDISAILPIIGTDQCERHMGSALAGGYLYAGSSVLSIFGSLGIVKAGISVLVACIIIPRPWASEDMEFKQSMVLGAKILQNSGFGLQGDVAPMIGMDGTRFKAETKLIQIMEEKHIDNPEKVSVKWKSREWNIMLVLFTIIASLMSGIPYFALLRGHATWRPNTHLPWLFPFLRTVGSCSASVIVQFIIQMRVVSLMKHRIMFMDIHRQLSDGFSKDNKDGLNNWITEHNLEWDPNLPAEQCILNLEHFLAYNTSGTQTNDVTEEVERHVSIEMENVATSSRSQEAPSSLKKNPFTPFSPPAPPPFNNDFKVDCNSLQVLRQKHFPSPTKDRVAVLISWTVLLLSLPATVAGYVGCFTLVSASLGNGPLVWLGLEAALSIIRIFIWAWNPLFDENTGITVELGLTDDPPMVTTAEHNAFLHDADSKKTKPLALVRERQFLEWITPFTGPLDQFQNPVNVALYFTLTADYSATTEDLGRKCMSLLLTVFDLNTRVGVTILKLKGLFYHFDANINYDVIYNGMIANLQLPMTNNHPWRMQDNGLFASLEDYYNYVVCALNGQVNKEKNIAILDRKWNLLSGSDVMQDRISASSLSLPNLTDHNQFYLNRGYEHHLKTKLVGVWSSWIVENMEARADDARCDCYEALSDVTSEKAKWELTELDRLVFLEWGKRELAMVVSSSKLEEILRLKMEKCITVVCKERNESRLEQRMRSGFDVGRWKRLDKERGEAKKRMEEAMKYLEERAEREGRSWKDQGWFAPRWQEGIAIVEEMWAEAIQGGPEALRNEEVMIAQLATDRSILSPSSERRRYDFVAPVKQRLKHWSSQRETYEWQEALDRIRRANSQREQMDIAYKYPEPDKKAAYKFVRLSSSSSDGKACSAMVYDTRGASVQAICEVIKKSTTRSVTNVDPHIVASIQPNDHLLFLGPCYGADEPAFIQRNRDRWWQQQTTNSALFYFVAEPVYQTSCSVYSGPVAQILIFLAAPSRVRLRLLHRSEIDFIISIRRAGETLHTFSGEMPPNFKLQNIELGEVQAGRHELQVAVDSKADYRSARYDLRDILIEFFSDTPTSKDDTKISWLTQTFPLSWFTSG